MTTTPIYTQSQNFKCTIDVYSLPESTWDATTGTCADAVAGVHYIITWQASVRWKSHLRCVDNHQYEQTIVTVEVQLQLSTLNALTVTSWTQASNFQVKK